MQQREFSSAIALGHVEYEGMDFHRALAGWLDRRDAALRDELNDAEYKQGLSGI